MGPISSEARLDAIDAGLRVLQADIEAAFLSDALDHLGKPLTKYDLCAVCSTFDMNVSDHSCDHYVSTLQCFAGLLTWQRDHLTELTVVLGVSWKNRNINPLEHFLLVVNDCSAGIGQRAPLSSASDTSSAVNGAHGGRRAWETAAAMERYFRSQDSWYASVGPRGGSASQAVVPMLRLSDLDRAQRAPDTRAAAFERVQASALLLMRPCFHTLGMCTLSCYAGPHAIAQSRISAL